MNLKDKKVLVTGGTGFLGYELVLQLLKLGAKVRVLARNESNLNTLKLNHPEVEVYCGDVNNSYSVKHACQGVDGLFHLGAFKHVTLAEKFALECIESNIIGSLNLLKESVDQKMEFAFFVSTDKAYTLNGNYSITKFLMEQLVKEYSNINVNTQYNIIRLGNILYSTGSVLCKWKDDLINNRNIKLTHPDAVRFFISKEHAVQEILTQLNNNIFENTPKIKGIKMGVLAELMIEKYNNKCNYEIIGLQAGENLNEKISKEFQLEEYSKEEIFNLI